MAALHPTPESFKNFLLGKLDSAECDEISAHLDGCPECQKSIAAFDNVQDTLVSQLSETVIDTEASQDPQLRRALDFVKQVGKDLTASGNGLIASQPILGRIREYHLLEKLGEGGMGVVYKAVHGRLNKVVAIKLLPREKMLTPGAVARFEREMRAIGNLDHPHLIHAHDAGDFEGTHFLVMEFVSGKDLHRIVNEHGPLDFPDACEAIRQAALGLEEAHRHGMVHRDIKPSNLMLTDKGQIKVLDLGLALLSDEGSIAELTTTGQVMGTLDYMAPEQCDSHHVDARADIYSLGASLYKLITGNAPFSGASYDTTVRKLMALANEKPVPLHDRVATIPINLSNLVDRLLAKEPQNRIATASKVAEELTPYCQNHNVIALLSGRKANREARSATHVDDTLVSERATREPILPLKNKTRVSERPPRLKRFSIALGFIGGLALLAAIVITLQTPHGVLRLEINDPLTEVRLVGSDIILKQQDKAPFEFSVGEHQLHIKHGETEFQTEKFQINRDKETLIKVELLPREIRVFANGSTPLGQQRLSDSKLQSELFDRQVLEWVQSKRAIATIRCNDRPMRIMGPQIKKAYGTHPSIRPNYQKTISLSKVSNLSKPAFWRKAS